MKPFSPKSARLQKYGLFFMLFGSLGFSLSMNPDHFNKIARNETHVQTLDLAQKAEAAEVKEADNKIEREEKEKAAKDTPPGEKAPRTIRKLVRSKTGSLYKANFQEDTHKQVSVTIEALEDGSDCRVCREELTLSSSIDKLSDLTLEVRAIIDGSISAPKAEESKDLDEKKANEIEAKLEKLAEKCENSPDEMRLSCHKDNIISLSKSLKNTKENEKYVNQYFRKHMESEMRSALYNRTLREVPAARCEGQVQYVTRLGMAGCMNNEKFEEAVDMVEEIISGLRTVNGKAVAEGLIKMRAGSFSSQLRNSQVIAREALNEGNFQKMNALLQMGALQPEYLQVQASIAYEDLMSSVDQMDGMNKQQIMNAVDSRFQQPVYSMLQQMKQHMLKPQTPTTNGQASAHPALDFMVPSLGGDIGSSPILIGDSHTPGLPGNIPTSIFMGRSQAQSRGGNLAPIPLASGNGMQPTANFQKPTWLDYNYTMNPSTQTMHHPQLNQYSSTPNTFSPALLQGRSASRRF